MVRFFRRYYLNVFKRGKADRLDESHFGGFYDCGNLVADVELLDHVLHVVVHRALAQAKDLRDLIGRFAAGG